MIYSLRGTLIYKDNDTAVIECAGVGYKCMITFNTLRSLPEIGKEAFLFTYMVVREDAVDLIGFSEKNELDCFKLLTSISGVGSKVAIAILSELRPEEIASAVVTSDAKTLTRASGVGNKLAQRIILELKDKMSKGYIGTATPVQSGNAQKVSASFASTNVQNAINALTVLGYAPADVAPVIANFDSSLPTEQLITLTLKEFGKK